MRNDVWTFHEADSHRLKHEQEQNDNVIEFWRDKYIRSCVARNIDLQFSQKTHIEMNYRINQLFHARQILHINYRRSNNVNEQNQRWHIVIRLITVIYFVFFFYNANILKVFETSRYKITAINFVNDINIK